MRSLCQYHSMNCGQHPDELVLDKKRKKVLFLQVILRLMSSNHSELPMFCTCVCKVFEVSDVESNSAIIGSLWRWGFCGDSMNYSHWQRKWPHPRKILNYEEIFLSTNGSTDWLNMPSELTKPQSYTLTCSLGPINSPDLQIITEKINQFSHLRSWNQEIRIIYNLLSLIC